MLGWIVFCRIFVDSLHSLNVNSTEPASCFLGASEPEVIISFLFPFDNCWYSLVLMSAKLFTLLPQRRHCYCRILEVLVNVWAYHSGRKMVYLNPVTGDTREQHLLDERNVMWVKFFNITLLKSMDEDLAEEADDGMHPGNDQWLWPLTGQVFWPGIADREREEKYIKKLDKKLKNKVKLLERQKSGYKQKPLGQWPWLKLTIQDLFETTSGALSICQCSCFLFSDCSNSTSQGTQKASLLWIRILLHLLDLPLRRSLVKLEDIVRMGKHRFFPFVDICCAV